MNANIKRLLIFLGVIIFILLVYLLGVHIHQDEIINNYQSSIASSKRQKIHYIKRYKTITVPEVKYHYDKKVPNIKRIMLKNDFNFKKGSKLSFNSSLHTKQFKKNKSNIMKRFGPNLGKLIISYIKPRNSEYKADTSPSSHLVKINVGYGQYTNDGQLPYIIFIVFKTPRQINYNEHGNPVAKRITKKNSTFNYGTIVVNGFISNKGYITNTHDYSKISNNSYR